MDIALEKTANQMDGMAVQGWRHRLGGRFLLLLALLQAVLGLRLAALEADQILAHSWGDFIFKPQLEFTTQFSDNVFFGNDDVLATNITFFFGIPVATNVVRVRPVESEVLLIASPGFKLQYGRRLENSVTLSYNFDRIFYVNNPDFNTDQHRAELGVKLQLSRFTITGSDQVSYLSSFLGGNQNTVGRQQVDRIVWTDNYRVTYDATAKTDIYLDVSHRLNDYRSAVNLYDTDTVRGSPGVTYKFSEQLGVFGELEFGQTTVNRNLPAQQEGRESLIFGGSVGLRGEFTPRLVGSAKVGYEQRVFPGSFAPGQEPESVQSPSVGMDLTYTPRPKTQFRLNYNRRSDVAVQFGQQSFVADSVRLTATQQIGVTGKWVATATLGFDLGNFSDTPGAISFARTDTTYNAGLRLIYQPRPWLSGILSYDYENYTSRFDDPQAAARTLLVDYAVNLVTLRIVIGY